MATTNYSKVAEIREYVPHTFNAMQHLVMAMADCQNSRGKRTFFGHDKGLKAYKKFEDKLRDTLLAMVLDSIVKRGDMASKYRETLLSVIALWAEAFPNWQDAYTFAWAHFHEGSREAEAQISALVGVPLGDKLVPVAKLGEQGYGCCELLQRAFNTDFDFAFQYEEHPALLQAVRRVLRSIASQEVDPFGSLESDVLQYHFGIEGETHSLEECADFFGMTTDEVVARLATGLRMVAHPRHGKHLLDVPKLRGRIRQISAVSLEWAG